MLLFNFTKHNFNDPNYAPSFNLKQQQVNHCEVKASKAGLLIL